MTAKNFNPGVADPVSSNTSKKKDAPKPDAPVTGAQTFSSFAEMTNNLGDLYGLGTVSVSKAQNNKTLSEVKELLDAVGSRSNNGDVSKNALHTVMLDGEQLNIPAIILVHVGKKEAHYMVSMVEHLGKAIPALRENYLGQEWEVVRPAYANWDAVYERMVENRVQEWLNQNGHKQTPKYVYHNVLASTVDLTDENQLGIYYDAAICAISNRIRFDEIGVTSPLKYTHLIPTDAKGTPRNVELAFVTEIHPGETVTSVTGRKLHADFTMRVEVRERNDKVQTIHNASESLTLSVVRGYVDFGYREQNGSQTRQVAGGIMIEPNYTPMIVITENSALGHSKRFFNDVTTQMLGVFGVAGLAQNGRWKAIFNRDPGRNSKVPSLGVFGLESTPTVGTGVPHKSERLNVSLAASATKARTYTPLEILDLFVSQDIAIAMDIEHAGPDAAVQLPIAAATPNSQWEQMLIKELDSFSGNVFGKVWADMRANGQAKSFHAAPAIMTYLGTLVDQKGELRDIRFANYLHFLDASDGAEDIMRVYSDAHSPNTYNRHKQYALRRRLEQMGSLNITGEATRIFLDTALLTAGVRTLEALNFNIVVQGLFDLNQSSGRGNTYTVTGQVGNSTLFTNVNAPNTTGGVPNYFASQGSFMR